MIFNLEEATPEGIANESSVVHKMIAKNIEQNDFSYKKGSHYKKKEGHYLKKVENH